MIENESTLSDLLPNYDDDRDRSSANRQSTFDTYENHFASQEQKKLAAILADPACSMAIWFLLHRC